MSYLPAGLPAPEPNIDDRVFWESCAERKLVFQACGNCGKFRHPPSPVCPYCQSTKVVWRDAPRFGRIFTLTTVHHPAHPAVQSAVPYNVSVVEFPECDGVRLVTNVVGDPKELSIGMTVELFWDEVDGSPPLPRFRKSFS